MQFRRRALLPAVLALAFAARIANLRGVFVNGDVVLYSIDAYYHLRLVWLTLLHFPHVPAFDHFLNHPEGGPVTWSAAFDLALAAVAWVAGGGSPDFHLVEVVAAWAPVVLGVITVAVVYLAGSEAFGEAAGILAACALALPPLHVYHVSAIGNADYHPVEILCLALGLWLLVRAERRPGAGAASFCAGAAFLLGLITWPGMIVPIGILGGAAAATVMGRWLRTPAEREGSALLRAGAVATLTAAAGFAPFAAMGARGPLGPLTYLQASWLQEIVLLGVAGACLAILVFDGRVRAAGRFPRRAAAGVLVGALVIAAALMAILPGLRASLHAALDYLLAVNPTVMPIRDSKPVTYWPLRVIAQEASLLLFVSPVLIGASLVAFFRGRSHDAALSFVAWTGLATLVLLACQFRRYGAYHLVPLGLLAGWAFSALRAAPSPRRRVAAWALVALLVPSLAGLRPTRSVNGHPDFAFVRDALEWMRYGTPSTRGLTDPLARPEYAVLAISDYGFWINVIGERANISSGFVITPAQVEGIRRSARVLLEEDESRAARMCVRWGARYVIVTPLWGYMHFLPLLVGRSVSEYGAVGERMRFRPPFFRMLDTRMLCTDGSAASDGVGGTLPPLQRFRLVYDSPDRLDWDVEDWGNPPPGFQEKRIAAVKIYEVVAGALLSGRTLPFHPVKVEVGVRSNIGRTFVWSIGGLSGPDGRFRFRVPYATGGRWRVGVTNSPDPYRVTCARREVLVRVDESVVREGRTVEVDCGQEKGLSPREGAPGDRGRGAEGRASP